MHKFFCLFLLFFFTSQPMEQKILNRQFFDAIWTEHDETKALALLAQGAQTDLFVRIKRQCHCPQNHLSKPFDDIPIINFIRCREMKELLKAVQEKAAAKEK